MSETIHSVDITALNFFQLLALEILVGQFEGDGVTETWLNLRQSRRNIHDSRFKSRPIDEQYRVITYPNPQWVQKPDFELPKDFDHVLELAKRVEAQAA